MNALKRLYIEHIERPRSIIATFASFRPHRVQPHSVKMMALENFFLPEAPVIETGTHRGDTTRALRQLGFEVYTIEVFEPLYAEHSEALRAAGAHPILGDSAVELPKILDADPRRSWNFWLDGHFSGDGTGRGECGDTPILAELDDILARLKDGRLKDVVIAIDDFNAFGTEPSYPSNFALVDRAREAGLRWTVSANIFAMSDRPFRDIDRLQTVAARTGAA